ncbi:macro domain-containing protein [Bifidobacterium longum]|nr:macro domain-containing protein [Bifidobacterium longum]
MTRKKKFAPNDNNLAIAYYRFSSHSQNEASIDQQRELAHAWADAHGFKIVKEYEDAAISGTTEDRPGFQQMLSEVAKIRPRVLIMWKTDRLGRDKYVLAMAKRTIRDAGCEIRLLAENIPTDGPEGVLIEGLMDAMAEYYSRQLSQNIQRGMDYNAQHALYNGHKLFGYGVDKSTKRYVVDPDTAPFVQRMFAEYAAGKAMQEICDEMNAQGLRTTRGAKFGVKTMNKMLQNRAYIGEYRHGDIVVEGGMPALVDEETFDKVQRKFAENKRKGSQRARGMDENDAPRYWLTGKVYCGKCGNTLQGVSGTSGTGRTYYYYYCSAQRRKQCTLKKVRKEKLEDAVTMILRSILHDSENLMSLAVDAAAYYEKNYRDTGYLDGLEAKRREVEKSLANLVKVIESGLISETVTERLVQLEEQKRALNEAIEAENIRAALCEDEHTIKAYFEKFLHADFDNPETRDQVLEYFVDKIYLTDDGLVVTSWYSEDRTEVTWDMLYGEDGNPFVKGEAVKFDCFPFGSTNPLRRKQAAWLYESKAERLSVIAPLIPCFPAILSCRICQLDELAGKKRFRLSSGLPIARCVEAIMLRRNQGGYMPLELVRQDITKMKVDAIVNAANTQLAMGGGVCGAIFRAAGVSRMAAACDRFAPIHTGEAVITPGFNLPSRYVIHTAGPIWRDGKHDEERLLRSCYRNSMELAARQGCASIAFPLISSGIYGYPKAEALHVALDEIRRFLGDAADSGHDLDVYLCVFDKTAFEISSSIDKRLRAYIDDYYVAEHEDTLGSRTYELLALQRFSDNKPKADRAVPSGVLDMPDFLGDMGETPVYSAPSAAPSPKSAGHVDDAVLSNLDEPFNIILLRLIDAKGYSDVEVYKRANINRKLFSKIRCGDGYMPSKKTVLALAIALRLNIDETQDILACAGYALSHSVKFDVIVEFFIVHEMFDVFTINEMLFRYDQPLLGQ